MALLLSICICESICWAAPSAGVLVVAPQRMPTAVIQMPLFPAVSMEGRISPRMAAASARGRRICSTISADTSASLPPLKTSNTWLNGIFTLPIQTLAHKSTSTAAARSRKITVYRFFFIVYSSLYR